MAELPASIAPPPVGRAVHFEMVDADGRPSRRTACGLGIRKTTRIATRSTRVHEICVICRREGRDLIRAVFGDEVADLIPEKPKPGQEET
jgi:hypothetical protein